MPFFFLFLFMAAASVNAQHADAYQQRIANNRLLVFFNAAVSPEEKNTLLRTTAGVTGYYHVPSPQVTVCMVNNRSEAAAALKQSKLVNRLSYFITDGTHYAGVLNNVFVKLKHTHLLPLLESKLRELQLPKAVADKYIPHLYLVKNIPAHAEDVVALCQQLSAEGWCAYASPDYLHFPLVTSNDALFNRQWAIHNTGTPLQGSGIEDADMDVDSAWLLTTGDASIKVSIIDSGVDTVHQDLLANILPGHDAVSDSTDGYPTPTFAEDGHGTCCAGIVAAVKDNTLGIAGVAPSCKIIPVRSFYYVQAGAGGPVLPISTAAAFADAIGWSWSVAGADVLSNSWGLPPALISALPGGTQPVEDAIQTAYANGRNGKGVPMFFSSGNENGSAGPIWPAKLPQTIAVNATSMCDERKNPNDCSGENWGGDYGPGLDFSAPGVRIPSTDMGGSKGYTSGSYYNVFNGTSAACPNAAGVGALVLSLRPDLTAENVRSLLAQTCDKVGGYGYDSVFTYGTWCNELGYGRLNAYRAVEAAATFTGVSTHTGHHELLEVYPNPAHAEISIKTGSSSFTVYLYAMNGTLVKAMNSEYTQVKLSVADLPQGIYTLQLIKPDETVNRKICIAR